MNETDEGRGGTFPYPDRNGVEALLSLIRTLRSRTDAHGIRSRERNDLGRYLLTRPMRSWTPWLRKSRALSGRTGRPLFQILFLVVLAEEEGSLRTSRCNGSSPAKMIRRHPHFSETSLVRERRRVKTNGTKSRRRKGRNGVNREDSSTESPAPCRPCGSPGDGKAGCPGRFRLDRGGRRAGQDREETLELEQAMRRRHPGTG